MIEILQLSGEEGQRYIGPLAEVLVDCVEGGASVSFMASFSQAEAEVFFENALASADRGERLVFAALSDSEVVGTVQVLLAMPPNQPHRGEIAKLLVRRRARGQGIAQRLMEAAENASRLAGKTLLVLDTASSAAEHVYTKMGWHRLGVIPNYALLPNGEPCATTFFWKELEPSVAY
jgi:GNAT superfamily N-acetyltransferase